MSPDKPFEPQIRMFKKYYPAMAADVPEVLSEEERQVITFLNSFAETVFGLSEEEE